MIERKFDDKLRKKLLGLIGNISVLNGHSLEKRNLVHTLLSETKPIDSHSDVSRIEKLLSKLLTPEQSYTDEGREIRTLLSELQVGIELKCPRCKNPLKNFETTLSKEKKTIEYCFDCRKNEKLSSIHCMSEVTWIPIAIKKLKEENEQFK